MAIGPIDYMVRKTVDMFERKFDEAIELHTKNGEMYKENNSIVIKFHVPTLIDSAEILSDVLLQVEVLYEKAGWDAAVIMREGNSYTMILNKN